MLMRLGDSSHGWLAIPPRRAAPRAGRPALKRLEPARVGSIVAGAHATASTGQDLTSKIANGKTLMYYLCVYWRAVSVYGCDNENGTNRSLNDGELHKPEAQAKGIGHSFACASGLCSISTFTLMASKTVWCWEGGDF